MNWNGIMLEASSNRHHLQGTLTGAIDREGHHIDVRLYPVSGGWEAVIDLERPPTGDVLYYHAALQLRDCGDTQQDALDALDRALNAMLVALTGVE